MANIVVKSAKFGIVVKELDTRNYKDNIHLIGDILRAIPKADWFEERGAVEQADVKPTNRTS
ncbi:MAG: hypothetical protein ACE5JU_24365 [Candidatus Binatia bacterium]